MFNIAGGFFIYKFCSLNTILSLLCPTYTFLQNGRWICISEIKTLKTGDIYIMDKIFESQVTDGK